MSTFSFHQEAYSRRHSPTEMIQRGFHCVRLDAQTLADARRALLAEEVA